MRTETVQDADIVVQKLPSDMGIHRNPRKGTLNAPDTILEGMSFEVRVMVDEVFPDEFDLEETHRRIENNTRELLDYGKPLISIGGDHSVSYPVLKALKKHNPGMELVWLDAHLDLKKPVDGHVSHDVVVRELLKHGFSPEEIWFVGVTRVDQDEEGLLEEKGFHCYDAGELDEFLEEFDPGNVYLSVDIDVLSPELTPGTGYPDGELSIEDVERVIEMVGPMHADLVEVAPPFDVDGKTVDAARKVLETLSRALDR
ncbi:MAG: arginase family protein [Candidatus Nanohaloarchaea archaeon]